MTPRSAGVLPRPRPVVRPGTGPPDSAQPRQKSSPIPLYRRTGRRRSEPPHNGRALVLVIVLHAVVIGLLLLGACAAMPAGAALLALQAQGWMTEHTIDLPTSGRLDRDLPQTATISSRD